MLKGYYFITDSALSRSGNTSDVKNAVACGVTVVQYRDKVSCAEKMYAQALKLKSLCCGRAIFLINDRIDIALATDADGVHLGCDDLSYATARKILGKRKIIGLTVHSLKEAKTAQKLGADYLALSPIFATGTKADAGKPVGVNLIKEIRKHTRLPLIAIGGINLVNAKEVISAGASGLCAISAVVAKPDVKKEIRKFQALFSSRNSFICSKN